MTYPPTLMLCSSDNPIIDSLSLKAKIPEDRGTLIFSPIRDEIVKAASHPKKIKTACNREDL
jgi:hypothetical protein